VTPGFFKGHQPAAVTAGLGNDGAPKSKTMSRSIVVQRPGQEAMMRKTITASIIALTVELEY
jgi:hypothetical protein